MADILTAQKVSDEGAAPDSVWHSWIVVPPVNNLTPHEGAKMVADSLIMQLPPPLLRNLQGLHGRPLTVLLQSSNVDLINIAMEQLYDWADLNRVWIEMTDLVMTYDDDL